MDDTVRQDTRQAHNYLTQISGGNYTPNDITVLGGFANYLKENKSLPQYKVAFICICLNPPYWQYAKEMIETAKKYFLPGHKTDFFLWSDMPDTDYGAKVFETEPVEWPLPTLMRYHLFLQQEKTLSKYDYVFYCDVDMRFVNIVGDEILGDGITACQHPMYALRTQYVAPTETNPQSTAYISKPQYYFAGGFQGGKSAKFIEAMKVMRKNIDTDFSHNYMSRWNDESHWNKYLFENPPAIVLSPSYIYPDSLIEEYYKKVWGCAYPPKLVTLTKKFSTSAEGGEAVRQMVATL